MAAAATFRLGRAPSAVEDEDDDQDAVDLHDVQATTLRYTQASSIVAYTLEA